MTGKYAQKNAVQVEKKIRDICLHLGVPLCSLALQNAGFGREAKSEGTLKKLNGT